VAWFVGLKPHANPKSNDKDERREEVKDEGREEVKDAGPGRSVSREADLSAALFTVRL
jgi:hypothetical protein